LQIWTEENYEKRRGGGRRGCLLENAVGKGDETRSMGDDGEGGTESAADPNDEDGCDAKTSVGRGTTA
jgi:hypothetical protein